VTTSVCDEVNKLSVLDMH